MNYNEIEDELRNLPRTWIPMLLRTLVIRAIRANVFVEGGLEEYVRHSIDIAKEQG